MAHNLELSAYQNGGRTDKWFQCDIGWDLKEINLQQNGEIGNDWGMIGTEKLL